MEKLLKSLFLAGALISSVACATTPTFGERDDVKAFISEISQKHDLDAKAITQVFNRYRTDQVILDAISRPAEGKPWFEYRPIFIQESRIKGGVKFWNKHQKWLEKANQEYGVPPEIIIAIIGVETRYGGFTGRRHTLRSLATLAFDYPPRSKFFRGELEQLFLLAKEQQFDLTKLSGSYAGALGIPQFIPTSYRNWAIDFDQDGKTDLINSPADAIGSVANYFKVHGWVEGGAVAEPIVVSAEQAEAFVHNSLQLKHTVGDMQAAGIKLTLPVEADAKAKLLELEAKNAPEHWMVYNNFYAISRYNHSALYSMAVFQLSQEIFKRRAN